MILPHLEAGVKYQDLSVIIVGERFLVLFPLYSKDYL